MRATGRPVHAPDHRRWPTRPLLRERPGQRLRRPVRMRVPDRGWRWAIRSDVCRHRCPSLGRLPTSWLAGRVVALPWCDWVQRGRWCGRGPFGVGSPDRPGRGHERASRSRSVVRRSGPKSREEGEVLLDGIRLSPAPARQRGPNSRRMGAWYDAIVSRPHRTVQSRIASALLGTPARWVLPPLSVRPRSM